MNDTPLSCWIIFELTGALNCAAHCNCMAGLGEVCTHIAAVLFYLEAAYRTKGVETCIILILYVLFLLLFILAI